MGHLVLVTGGARSGKSEFAEEAVRKTGKKIVYIATAIAFDDGMKDRIRKHQERRPKNWKTIECYKGFEQLQNHPDFIEADTILFDCLTIMTSNNMFDMEQDFDNCSMEKVNEIEQQILHEVEVLLDVCRDKNLYLVTNELGMGLAPAYKLGGYFRDIAGKVNQLAAAKADEVYFTVSGIPIQIK